MPVDKSSRVKNVNRVTEMEAAHRAVGIAGIMRSRLMTERLARKQQDGTLGETTEMHEDEMLSDMNVNVGDTIINQPSQQPPALQKAASKLPLVAALLAAGGIGAGAAVLPQLLDKEPTPVVEPMTDTDTDTQYDLRISSG
jgi:hypothetical protein